MGYWASDCQRISSKCLLQRRSVLVLNAKALNTVSHLVLVLLQ